jgi:hypothetical protein
MLNIQVIHELFDSALVSWFTTIRTSEFKKLMVLDNDAHSDEYDREQLNTYIYMTFRQNIFRNPYALFDYLNITSVFKEEVHMACILRDVLYLNGYDMKKLNQESTATFIVSYFKEYLYEMGGAELQQLVLEDSSTQYLK